MYVLLQLYRKVLHLHGRISRASQTHPACVSDAFGRYLAAELYCTAVCERHTRDEVKLISEEIKSLALAVFKLCLSEGISK